MLSQPYPANLMMGFYATGDPSEPIRIDLDKELEGTHRVANSNHLGSLYRQMRDGIPAKKSLLFFSTKRAPTFREITSRSRKRSMKGSTLKYLTVTRSVVTQQPMIQLVDLPRLMSTNHLSGFPLGLRLPEY